MKKGSKHSGPEQPIRRRLSTSDRIKPKTYSRARTISDIPKAHKFRSDRDEELKREKRAHRSRVFFVVCIIISLIVALALTQIYFDATYVSFNDDTDKVTRQPDFDKMVTLTRDYLNRHPFERISFLMNGKGLEQYIIAQIPEIKEVKLQKAGLFTNSLSISLRHPIASFKNQYVDSEGVVFGENFYSSPQLEIIDNSGAGEGSLSSGFLGFIGRVVSGLGESDLVTRKIIIPPGAIRYVEFYIEGVNYPFEVQIDRNPDRQVSDIVNMKKYLDKKGITPNYVDVRVEGKGYWR